MLQTMLGLQLQMFALMALGFLAARAGVIDASGEKGVSSLLIYVVLPANILHGFAEAGAPSPEFMLGCAEALALSAAIQLAATAGSRRLFARMRRERAAVASYGMIVSNSSFVGLPVAEALLGGVGVAYTSVFQIPIRLTMWTAGLALFCEVDGREAVRRVATHPCIVACVAGLAMMCAGVGLPGLAGECVDALSACTTPLSMLAIGAILAGADARDVASADTAWFCALRLVAFPLAAWAATGLLGALLPGGLDPALREVAVLMSAMPAGSTTAILPERYGCDARYGAGLILASTALSVATLPLLSALPM